MGAINMYKYNSWGVLSDRFPTHPDSVNCVIADFEEYGIVYTGCADGLVRKLSLNPNRIVSSLLALNEPVESLTLLKTESSKFLVAITGTDSVIIVIDLAVDNLSEPSLVKDHGKLKLMKEEKRKEEMKKFLADL